MTRRLPVYLMVDCSESMAGPAIDAVNGCVQTLVAELRSNPQALETAYISIITFSRVARQVVPLTELLALQVPPLKVRPGTALGAALSVLLECMKREVVRTSATTKGDYRPLVFLMTDGQPTDNWSPAANAVRCAKDPTIGNFYAIGVGNEVDTDVLYKISDVVLSMPEVSAETYRKLFVWLTASIRTASASVASGGDVAANPVKVPEDVFSVPARGAGRRSDSPMQVFLHARCSKTKRPYLMRYVRVPAGPQYVATASHPLDELDPGDVSDLPPVNSSMLLGCPPCPYCGNPRAGVCACGAVLCVPARLEGPTVCPQCSSMLNLEGSGSFDIRRTDG